MGTPRKAVLIVGHGAAASDTPLELVGELKRLESERQRKGGAPSPRELEVDAKVRAWPRTPKTDPYQAGLEAIAQAVRKRLPGRAVAVAYNEFCAPTIEEAVAALERDGAREISVIPTMYTRGGLHSEREIPEILESLRKARPGLTLRYAWPLELDAVAGFLAGQIEKIEI